MTGRKMPFNQLVFSFPHLKAVTVAKVVMRMKKLKDRRPASAAELQKKKALLEKVSLTNCHRLSFKNASVLQNKYNSSNLVHINVIFRV